VEKTLDMARTAHLKLTKSNELDQEQEKPAEMMEGTVLEAPIHRIDIESLEKRKKSMNEKQKEIFEKVIKAVKRPAYDDSSALCCFVSGKGLFKIFFKTNGIGGSGKTFLIHLIRDEILNTFGAGRSETEMSLRPLVLVAATTGFAAMAITGSTLHSLLAIEVQHGREAAFASLGGGRLTPLQNLFQCCRLLVIDEISMMSNILLIKLNQRLREIKESDKRE